MTRQQNNTPLRITIGITLFFEAVLLIASYALRHFTSKRLGMLRHVIERNKHFEKIFPSPTLQLVLLAFGLILIAVILLCLRRRTIKKRLATADAALGIVLALLYFVLLFKFNSGTLRDYYYQLLVWSLAIFSHMIRQILLLVQKK